MIDPQNSCDKCGKRADITAAFWGGSSGPFDPPTGYACRECEPAGFADLDAILGGA